MARRTADAFDGLAQEQRVQTPQTVIRTDALQRLRSQACALALVVISSFYTHDASQQADAGIEAAKAAQDTLTEIRKGGADTHDLAVAAQFQARR